jgi:hypothetical protein
MADFSYIGPGRTIASSPYGFTIQERDGTYYDFVPRSVFEKGVVEGDKQYYFPSVLSTPDFFDQARQNSRYLTTEAIEKQVGKDFTQDLKKYGYEDTDGYLFPLQSTGGQYFTSWVDQNIGSLSSYEIGDTYESNGLNIKRGQITGIGSYEGQPVFTYDTAGSSEPIKQGWISYNPETGGGKPNAYWFIPGKENKFAKTLGVIGGGLIALGTAGLAGIGPLAAGSGAAAGAGAAGGAALGSGLSTTAAGTTGLTAGAAGAAGISAPAGFTLAPGVGSTLAGGTGLLGASNFYGVGETGLIPGATEGLQIPTAPGLSSMGGGTGLLAPVEGGMVSQLGLVPAGATPVLGDPRSFINDPNLLDNTVFSTDYLAAPGAAATGGSQISNVLRAANALMGQPQQAQQMGMGMGGGRQAGAVDYSGVLGLLAQQARTPGVSSLAAPAQLQPMFQPTLLPNVLSLLG